MNANEVEAATASKEIERLVQLGGAEHNRAEALSAENAELAAQLVVLAAAGKKLYIEAPGPLKDTLQEAYRVFILADLPAAAREMLAKVDRYEAALRAMVAHYVTDDDPDVLWACDRQALAALDVG